MLDASAGSSSTPSGLEFDFNLKNACLGAELPAAPLRVEGW